MTILDLEKDSCTYAHVISAMEHPHKVIITPFKDAIIIHCTVSDVHIVEYAGRDYDKLSTFLNKLPIVRLQTTNQEIYKRLIAKFKHHYTCQQVVFPASKNQEPADSNLVLLKKSDLSYVQQSYEMPEYISQLFDRNRLFGWYEHSELIGYVAFHIDETVGALFVKPEFRKNGYGAKIMKAAFLKYDDGIRYSQILSENQSSIQLHKKLGCDFGSKEVCWVYNNEYIYND